MIRRNSHSAFLEAAARTLSEQVEAIRSAGYEGPLTGGRSADDGSKCLVLQLLAFKNLAAREIVQRRIRGFRYVLVPESVSGLVVFFADSLRPLLQPNANNPFLFVQTRGRDRQSWFDSTKHGFGHLCGHKEGLNIGTSIRTIRHIVSTEAVRYIRPLLAPGSNVVGLQGAIGPRERRGTDAIEERSYPTPIHVYALVLIEKERFTRPPSRLTLSLLPCHQALLRARLSPLLPLLPGLLPLPHHVHALLLLVREREQLKPKPAAPAEPEVDAMDLDTNSEDVDAGAGAAPITYVPIYFTPTEDVELAFEPGVQYFDGRDFPEGFPLAARQ